VPWRRNLVKEFGTWKTNHEFGPSTVLKDGRWFVAGMHQEPDGQVLALDAKTGKDTWKKDRSYPAKDEGNDSYSTPILRRWGGRMVLVVAGAEALDACDPATGNRLWRLAGLGVPHRYGRTIAGPTAADGGGGGGVRIP
jgi:outer membrane protein assembly factor BamB